VLAAAREDSEEPRRAVGEIAAACDAGAGKPHGSAGPIQASPAGDIAVACEAGAGEAARERDAEEHRPYSIAFAVSLVLA
jgi:hypothetical protein